MLHEAAAKNIAVLGIQEMRRPGRTVSTAAGYRVFYSGLVQGGQQGVALAVKKSICKLLSRLLLLYFSDDGIDGSGRCFLECEDGLHTTDGIILTESEGTGRETGRMVRVQSHLQGNINLNPLSMNTEVYCCTPIYRFITCRMADDSTSTLQAHILPACLITNFP